MSSNEIIRSYGIFIFNFWRKFHVVFYSDYNNLHSHQQLHESSIFSRFSPTFVFSCVFVFVVFFCLFVFSYSYRCKVISLIGVNWNRFFKNYKFYACFFLCLRTAWTNKELLVFTFEANKEIEIIRKRKRERHSSP